MVQLGSLNSFYVHIYATYAFCSISTCSLRRILILRAFHLHSQIFPKLKILIVFELLFFCLK